MATKYPSYMGLFKTKAEAQRRAGDRSKYGYAHKIERVVLSVDGRKLVRYKLWESQRPVRHTWWEEHLSGESVEKYLARMRRKGIKAYRR